MDDEYETDEEEWVEAPARRATRIDLLIVGLDAVRGVLTALAESATLAQNVMASHANFKALQAAFHEEAAIQIETMTSGESDG